VISGPKINDHIHLIFPNDPLAAHPMSRLPKKKKNTAYAKSTFKCSKWYISNFDILCLCVCVESVSQHNSAILRLIYANTLDIY